MFVARRVQVRVGDLWVEPDSSTRRSETDLTGLADRPSLRFKKTAGEAMFLV